MNTTIQNATTTPIDPIDTLLSAALGAGATLSYLDALAHVQEIAEQAREDLVELDGDATA